MTGARTAGAMRVGLGKGLERAHRLAPNSCACWTARKGSTASIVIIYADTTAEEQETPLDAVTLPMLMSGLTVLDRMIVGNDGWRDSGGPTRPATEITIADSDRDSRQARQAAGTDLSDVTGEFPSATNAPWWFAFVGAAITLVFVWRPISQIAAARSVDEPDQSADAPSDDAD